MRKKLTARRTRAPAYWWRRIARPRSLRIDGFTVEVDEKAIGRTATRALWRGTYEEAERFLVRSSLKPTDRVIEAGGGLGIVTMNIARIVGANVVVYEASPVTAELLRRNLKRNGYAVEVRNRGLSDNERGERFVHADNIRGSSSVAPPRGGAVHEIPTDDIARMLGEFPANTLVLDIEGREIDVLSRAPLDGIDKVIVEIHPRHLGDAPYLPFYRRMFDSGFLLRHEKSFDDVLLFERI